MANKLKKILVLAMCSLALSNNYVFADNLPLIKHISIQVKPLYTVISSGKMLSLDVNCEGIKGLGAEVPLFVTGTPEGTSIEIITISEAHAVINLTFPTTVARGVWELDVIIGSPTPLIKQKIAIEFKG
jgi:hypothetical protein